MKEKNDNRPNRVVDPPRKTTSKTSYRKTAHEIGTPRNREQIEERLAILGMITYGD